MSPVNVDATVSVQSVLQALYNVGAISELRIQQRIKPGHGPCCTCQACGRHHDECVCSSNEIIEAIMALVE